MLRNLVINGCIFSLKTTKCLSTRSRKTIFGRPISTKVDSFAGTMDEVNKKMMEAIGLEPGYQPLPKSREHLLKYQPKPEDLPDRTMQDSFSSALIPLSTDKGLQDKYITALGTIRLGRLMEDMDMFAVWTCHKHLCIPSLPSGVHLPYTFVTILVDKIIFSKFSTSAVEDVRISGHVSFVGKSSLEIVVWLEQMENNKYRKITRALFLMAARNATNTGAAPVNQLKAGNDEEAEILNTGNERTKKRKSEQQKSIFKVEPNDLEQTLMYQLFQRTTPPNTLALNERILPGGSTWMSDSLVVNTIRSYPENRNAHNSVFGGFLMRNSLEISHLASCLYSKHGTTLRAMSDITFSKPIKVNSIIRFTVYVIYTEMNYMQILALADVLDSRTSEQVTTNSFSFTYASPEIVPEVIPRSYQEMLWYIHGRRKFRYAMNLD